MSSESFDVFATVQTAAPAELAAQQHIIAVGCELPPASLDQIRATDAVFARQDEDAGAGLLGAWAAGMLVHEIIGDHLTRQEPDEEEKPRPKRTP